MAKKIKLSYDPKWAQANSKEEYGYVQTVVKGLRSRFKDRFGLVSIDKYSCEVVIDIIMDDDMLGQWLLMTLRGISNPEGMIGALRFEFLPYDSKAEPFIALPWEEEKKQPPVQAASPAVTPPQAPPASTHEKSDTPLEVSQAADDGDKKPSEPTWRQAYTGTGKSGNSPDDKAASRDNSVQKVLDSISELIGCEEFKALSREIALIAPEIIKRRTYDSFVSQRYLFSIGMGSGLTKYLENLAALIGACKLCPIDKKTPVLEITPAIPKGDDVYVPFPNLFGQLGGKYSDENCKVICIDISAWISKLNSPEFTEILWYVSNELKQQIVVFRIPFVENDVLNKVKRAISNVLQIRELTFVPLTTDEIKSYAQQLVAQKGFTVNNDAWEVFGARIREEKSDGKFYEFRTILKVVSEMLYIKQLYNAKNSIDDSNIKKCEIESLSSYKPDNRSGMEMLDDLIGVEKLKERIEEMVAQITFALQNKSVQSPCIHMRFVGNPGTGKTTIARILGKILQEHGVLRNGNFYEYKGRDFCGRYIGETAPKTSAMCRDAYGSVLFIDEAYSLYNGEDDSRDYGKEAIDTMVAEMENHRNDMVIIMAGYPDDMKRLMKANSGLASRMPYTLEFPNYSREQLFEIFMQMVKRSFTYEDALTEAARDYFMALPDAYLNTKEFGNARFVRNLYERTWAKTAMWRMLSKNPGLPMSREDFVHACSESEFANALRDASAAKKPMGFDV